MQTWKTNSICADTYGIIEQHDDDVARFLRYCQCYDNPPVTSGFSALMELLKKCQKWEALLFSLFYQRQSIETNNRFSGDRRYLNANATSLLWIGRIWFESWLWYECNRMHLYITDCAGNSLVIDEFPSQRPVTGGVDVFFDLCLNIGWLNKFQGDWRRPLAHYDITLMALVNWGLMTDIFVSGLGHNQLVQ